MHKENNPNPLMYT